MKKKNSGLFVMAVLGMLSGFTQTISTQKGLTTAVFTLPAGTVKVYLPGDMRNGETISGTVIANPTGNTPKKIAVNIALLKQYVIGLTGQQIAVSNQSTHFQSILNNKAGMQEPLELVAKDGSRAGQLNIPYSQATAPTTLQQSCIIPSHVLTASPLRITGPFDGNSSNTNCTVGGNPVEVLAESPRQCFIQLPTEAKGIQPVSVKENNQMACSKKVSLVDMNISAGKLNLQKGEKTFVNVQLTGLQNLPDTAFLTVDNNSTTIVSMQPANHVFIPIDPGMAASGKFQKDFNIQSNKTGTFIINVSLDLPGENPPIYADVEVHKQEVKGLKNGIADAFEKYIIEVTGSQASQHPELDNCGSCISCMKAVLNEDKVALVGWLGETLISHFAGLGLDAAGGVAKWLKDKYEKIKNAQDAADAINDAIKKNEIQVVEIAEKQCDKNNYCLVSGIAFYDTKTSCIEVFLKCTASKLCCNHVVTTFHLKYCVGDRGSILPKETPQGEIIIQD